MRGLIIGYDPGEYSAVALFDLKGRLVYKLSKKDLSEEGVIRIIREHGKALIVATDKKIVPKSVEKLAMRLNVKVFNPSEDLPVKQKIELARKFHPRDDHERDSIAAAYFAYLSYKKLLDKIEEKLNRLSIDFIFEKIIKEELPISKIIDDFILVPTTSHRRENKGIPIREENRKSKINVEKLLQKLREYEMKINALLEENYRLRKALNELKRNIKIEVNIKIEGTESNNKEEIDVRRVLDLYRSQRLKKFFH